MCAHLKDQMERRDLTFKFVGLDIEEIMLSGDLAVVRAVWTYTITPLNSKEKSTFKEIELDVLKRQKDGKWKISISYTWETPA
jgi:ketosteroid isomerase-like protein